MTAMEREISEPIDLCDARGVLNPDAIGWGRHPQWNCNLRGRFGRKKRWDYWCFMGPEHLVSICLANIDYLGLCGAYVLEYATGTMAECGAVWPFPSTPALGPSTCGTSAFGVGATRMSQQMDARGGVLRAASPNCGGKPLNVEMRVIIAPGQETLNVVVPWSPTTFQFTSKQLPLAAEGEVRWGDAVWRFEQGQCFGVRDFGRGIWPFHTTWNWAAMSGHCADGQFGINLGGQWTDGTGATENGLLLNGVLHPIAATARFEYERRDFMKPWRLHTPGDSAVDLEFTPFYERVQAVNLGLLKTAGHQCFGRFNGTVRAGGHVVEVLNALGWAEEHDARW